MSRRIIILHGPNLNLLGTREPEIYGTQTFEQYLGKIRAQFPQINFEYLQSNHEGQLIDWLHGFGFMVDGIILNAGGYSHTSIALRDAVSAITSPVIEVHISDVHKREPFRHHSYLSDVCIQSVTGEGMPGYARAVQLILDQSKRST